MTTLGAKIKEAAKFVKSDIWKIRLKDQPKNRSFLIKQLRIILLAFRGFDEDKCTLRASALTFYSLLSVVPVLAMIFGIAKGFGFEQKLESQLAEKLAGHEDILVQALDFAHSMLDNTKGGLIAGFGIVLLFWAVMKVLGNIEQSFNDIWEIKRSRVMVRKFSDYLSIMLIAPIFIIMSGSATVFITTQLAEISESIAVLGFFGPVIHFLMRLIPYALVWLLLTFIYIIMPNTKVTFKSALFAGIIAGTCFQMVEWAYINFQIGVAQYNAIYGSFAALPLFLVWMQISWLIVLFGAELSFAHQTVDRYEIEIDSSEVSIEHKRLLSLLIMHLLIGKFAKAEHALTTVEISDHLNIPIRVVRQIIFELMESDLLVEINTEDPKLVNYHPARSIDKISINSVIDALEQRGTEDIPISDSEELKSLQSSMDAFKKEMKKSAANKLLKDI